MRKKIVGIIGGMGPAATVDLFSAIVENTEAYSDQEHIHILIDCNTQIPDRTNAIINGAVSPKPYLVQSAIGLEQAGADFLIIPCNTSHFFIKDIREAVNIPVLDMIELTAFDILRKDYKTAIILCTEGTRKTNIYSERFNKLGIKTVYPDDTFQREVSRIIYDGIKRGSNYIDVSSFNQYLYNLEKEENAISVLGCTELPLAVKKYGLIGNFINPTYCLACNTITNAGYCIRPHN